MSAYSDQRIAEVVAYLNKQIERGREFIEPAKLIYCLHLKPLASGVTKPLRFIALNSDHDGNDSK